MRIKTELELLDAEVRQQVVEEIRCQEEKERREIDYAKDQVYRDQTKRWVYQKMLKQFSPTTVDEMRFSISNLSLCRKIVNKLAKVYSHGVTRFLPEDPDNTARIDKLEDLLNVNTKLKDSNRGLKNHRNYAVYLKPCPYFDENGDKKYRVRLTPLAPHLYSVIEDYYDRTRPMAYILSNYTQSNLTEYAIDAAAEGRSAKTIKAPVKGDAKDQAIADTKEDEGIQADGDRDSVQYIFWTDNLHFTLDEAGNFVGEDNQRMDIQDIDDERIKNPFGEMPIENLAIEQNNSFWAEGGDDLIDGAILVNCMMTHYNHIAVTQGYGQLVLEGSKLPQQIEVGPNKAIKLERENPDEVASSAQYINANPNLTDFLTGIETYTAILLSTNNLSTKNVSANLGDSQVQPSGIAAIIDNSESVEDVRDQQQIFLDAEPNIWRKLNNQLMYFKGEGSLDPELEELVLPEGFDKDLVIKFNDPTPIIDEEQKLNILERRKSMGLDTMVDLMMRDNPDMTAEEAEAKILVVQEEKLKRMSDAMGNVVSTSDDEDKDDGESDKDEGDEQDDSE